MDLKRHVSNALQPPNPVKITKSETITHDETKTIVTTDREHGVTEDGVDNATLTMVVPDCVKQVIIKKGEKTIHVVL